MERRRPAPVEVLEGAPASLDTAGPTNTSALQSAAAANSLRRPRDWSHAPCIQALHALNADQHPCSLTACMPQQQRQTYGVPANATAAKALSRHCKEQPAPQPTACAAEGQYHSPARLGSLVQTTQSCACATQGLPKDTACANLPTRASCVAPDNCQPQACLLLLRYKHMHHIRPASQAPCRRMRPGRAKL
jgi:hypothetical protein